MRQRLGIAAALLRRPRLLILDEPATGLDPAGMRDMRQLIRRLADEGITVLLSSHQLPEVQELCDRVAIVDSGRVVYEGALADLRRQGGAGYRLRTTDDARALELRARPGRHRARRAAASTASRFQAEERDVGELSLALGRAGVGDPRADARAGDARGPVLPADRGRRRDARGDRRVRRGRHAAPRRSWWAGPMSSAPPPRPPRAAPRPRARGARRR